MPDFSKIAGGVLDLGKILVPMLVPGAAGILEIADKFDGLLDKAKKVANPEQKRELGDLQKQLAQRAQEVLAHADKTSDKLRGKDD